MTNVNLKPVFDLLERMVSRLNKQGDAIDEINERETLGLFTVMRRVSGAYIMTDNDTTIFMDVSGAVGSILMQTAVGQGGRIIIIKDDLGNAAANTITVNAAGAENIDGLASQTIVVNWGRLGLQSNGVNWRIIFN